MCSLFGLRSESLRCTKAFVPEREIDTFRFRQLHSDYTLLRSMLTKLKMRLLEAMRSIAPAADRLLSAHESSNRREPMTIHGWKLEFLLTESARVYRMAAFRKLRLGTCSHNEWADPQ